MDLKELRQKERMTYAEAAEYCGLSVRTMKRWAGRGWIRVIRFTNCSVFVLRSSVDSLVEELARRDAERSEGDSFVTLKNMGNFQPA